MTSFFETFDLSLEEMFLGQDAARQLLRSPRGQLFHDTLAAYAPGVAAASRSAITNQAFNLFSETGLSTYLAFHRNIPSALASLQDLWSALISEPVVFQDLAEWCFAFAALDASARFQMDLCPSPNNENGLSTALVTYLGSACDAWARTMQEPLSRRGGHLALHHLDLSILGGEQSTGGDFGLILEFDGATATPESDPRPSKGAVPIVLQAKRYTGDLADVSRHHPVRGYQYSYLAGNPCASAYIFYDNGSIRNETPLPPIVKPVDKVAGPGRTPVQSDSLDLPAYLLTAISDEKLAPRANDPDQALKMIFAKADPGQLSTLAVISAEQGAAWRYAAALEKLADFRLGRETERH
jgi:hypothetical protein